MNPLKEQIEIGIGEYYASREGVIIYTLLGSCVAVCLFDPENGIGGMNHILMPGEPHLAQYNASARYGVNAMELLINGIMKLGGNRHKLIAKTFGGANVIPAISESTAVGKRLTDFVVDFLDTEKIRIVGRDFGGHDTRKIYFHTDTGDVYLKRIASMQSVIRAERAKLEKARRKLSAPGEVTFFSSSDPPAD